MKRPTYIKVGFKFYAFNLEAGSSELVKAIVSKHYPVGEDLMRNGPEYPEGSIAEDISWRIRVERLPEPEGEVVLVVRDPVDKFLATCGKRGIGIETIDFILNTLENAVFDDPYFLPQVSFTAFGCKLYRFEEHLDTAAAALSLDTPLPRVTEITAPYALSDSQVQRIKAIYAGDLELHASIMEPGQAFSPKPEEPSNEQKLQEKIAAVTEDAMESFSALPLGKQALWEPLRVRVYELIQLGDFEKAVETLRSVPNLYEGMEAERELFISKLSTWL